MGLGGVLEGLLAPARLRPLVRAMRAAAARLEARATLVDPRLGHLARLPDRWLAGDVAPDRLAAAASRAAVTSLAAVVGAPVAVIVAAPEARPALVQRFARDAAARTWWETTDAGRAWRAAHPAGALDAEAAAAVAGVEAELARVAAGAALGVGWQGAVNARLEAAASLSGLIFEAAFRARHERAVARARREQGPVRVFTPAGDLVATLPAPADAWAFGAGLFFADDTLWIEGPDQRQAVIYQVHDAGLDEVQRLATPPVKWDDWCAGRALAPGWAWASEALFQRESGRWRRVSRCPRPLALSDDGGVIVWAGAPLEVGAGRPGTWADRWTLPLPGRPTAATLAPDGARLAVMGPGFALAFARAPGGWVPAGA